MEVDSNGTVGQKDLFLTKGIRSTAGSNVLREYVCSILQVWLICWKRQELKQNIN